MIEKWVLRPENHPGASLTKEGFSEIDDLRLLVRKNLGVMA